MLKGKYCFVFHSRTPDAKVHKTNVKGLPQCGARVGTDALEHTDRLLDAASFDECKKCFRETSLTSITPTP